MNFKKTLKEFVREYYPLFKEHSKKVLKTLDGRAFLWLGAILMAAVLSITVNQYIHSVKEERAAVQTTTLIAATDVRDEKTFDHVLKTDHGSFIAEGVITIPNEECATLPEMTTDTCFSKVIKQREKKVSDGEDGYKWVEDGSPEVITVSEGEFLGKIFDYPVLEVDGKSIKAKEIIDKDTLIDSKLDTWFFGLFGGHHYVEEEGERFAYYVVPDQYYATIQGETVDGGFAKVSSYYERGIDSVKENPGLEPSKENTIGINIFIILFALVGASLVIAFNYEENTG